MANKTQTIRIESILGGISQDITNTSFDQQVQCKLVDYRKVGQTYYGVNRVGGMLSPIGIKDIGATGSLVNWIKANPKDEKTYVYDSVGSVYTVSYNPSSPPTVAGLGDLNDGGTSTGNGCEYYDNYIYFARDTTVARYGPLNGTPSFTDDYWVTTLGKTALSDTTYPDNLVFSKEIPNHVMHRHSDGRLYIADVIDNQGVLHFIQTSKTTVEGDTNDGSTYDKINFGYGIYPTCIASYGENLVIGLIETADLGTGTSRTVRTKNAKLAFWDTTSENPNLYVWESIPQALIIGIVNLNGVLYCATADTNVEGFKIYKYIGGESVQEIFSSTAYPPGIGAFVAGSEQLYCGMRAFDMKNGRTSLRELIFGETVPSAIAMTGDNNSITGFAPLGYESPLFSAGTTGSLYTYRTDVAYRGAETSTAPLITFGPFRIGQPFKVTKITFNLETAVSSGLDLSVYLAKDGENISSPTAGTVIDTIIADTNHNGLKHFVLRPDAYTGNESFCLKFYWDNASTLTSVLLPITIEYELIDD